MNSPMNRQKTGVFIVLLMAFPFIAYWQIGLMRYTMKWDMLDQFFPYRYFISESLRAGYLPMWNPYQHLGWPFHADPQSGFWYPVSWLLALTRGYDVYTMNLEFVLHIVLGGIGFFVMLKGLNIRDDVSLLCSIAYQGCGIFVNNAQHLTWVVAIAWLPFAVHHFLRMLDTTRIFNAVGAGVFMMLMLTGGYPAFTIITQYFLISVLFIKIACLAGSREWREAGKILTKAAVAYSVFALLACGYLISFWEALPYISRGIPLSLEEALEGAYPLKAFVSLLFPFAVTKNDGTFNTDLSMLNVYTGLVPLISAAASVLYFRNAKVMLFLILGSLSLAAALGDLLPVREFLYRWLPMMDKFRFPSIFRTFFVFSFLAAGAIAMKKATLRWSISRKIFLIPVVALLLATGGIHFYALEKADYFVKFPSLVNVNNYFSFFERSGIYHRIAIQSMVQFGLLALLVFILIMTRKPARLVVALLAVTVADIFLSVQFNLPATAISNKKTGEFQARLAEMPKGFPLPSMLPVIEAPAYDPRLAPSWYNQNIFLKQISPHGFNSFYLREYMKFYDSAQRDSVLKNPLAFVQPAEAGQVKLTGFTPNEFDVQVSLEKEAQLTLLQSRYPGWKIIVDGKSVAPAASTTSFLAATIQPGSYTVNFIYAPAYVKPAMMVSYIGIIAALIFMGTITIKRPCLRESHAAPDAKISS